MTKLRRNQVVMRAKVDLFRFYSRVNRRIDSEHVEVIDCGANIKIYRDDELEVVDYKGRWDTFGELRTMYPVWLPMPSLRKLKQMTARYNKRVWKKYR